MSRRLPAPRSATSRLGNQGRRRREGAGGCASPSMRWVSSIRRRTTPVAPTSRAVSATSPSTARRSARRPVRSRKWSWLRSMKLGGAALGQLVLEQCDRADVELADELEPHRPGPASLCTTARRRVPMWSHVRLRSLEADRACTKHNDRRRDENAVIAPVRALRARDDASGARGGRQIARLTRIREGDVRAARHPFRPRRRISRQHLTVQPGRPYDRPSRSSRRSTMPHFRKPLAIAIALAVAAGVTGTALRENIGPRVRAEGGQPGDADGRPPRRHAQAPLPGLVRLLDPQIDYTLEGWQLEQATQDGLVNFKKAQGTGGLHGRPRPRDRDPQADRRRQDVGVQRAQGDQVLQRQGPQAE